MAEIQQARQINKNKAEGVCHLIYKQVCSLAEKEGGGRRAIEYLHISCNFVLANQRLTTVQFAEAQKI